VSATVTNKNRLDHEKAVIERRVAKERASATETRRAHQRHDAPVRAPRSARTRSCSARLRAATSRSQLKKANVDIDHRWVQLEAAVKALGKYEVPVRLAAGVVASLKFWVVGKDK